MLCWRQAVKRLLTFCQRAFPTDPSRSVDFDSFRDAGRGAAGSGSDKQVPDQASCSSLFRRGMLGCEPSNQPLLAG
jgi:hypothetical protein